MRVGRLVAVALAGAVALGPGVARAEFPYPAPTGPPGDYAQYKLPPGQVPDDLQGKLEWMYAASPEPGNATVNADPTELNGVRGAHLVDAGASFDTAWQTTTGRPDVTIATLDSGIMWDDRGAMQDLRKKTRLNRGELPVPETGGAAKEGVSCAAYTGAGYDRNEDGVFNVMDYACDDRVPIDSSSEGGVGPADLIDPQDVLIAFSGDGDGDGNGFDDDIVGWDFLDDDNDPYDDVSYGHGTGEARDSSAEADNHSDGGELATCPNCMVIHMRVGDSFIADENRYAQAVVYAVDNDVLVVQEALGTLNHTRLGREATEYAYDNGVAVIASAADEAAQHHNWPSSNPHVILVNSVTKYKDYAPENPADAPFEEQPRSYLKFNGCTNFSSKITVAIPSVSCSSDATGRGSGMAGLIYSAALNAREQGKLDPHPECDRADGGACAISVNEVRQLMASGTIGGTPQSDDVDFMAKPEISCAGKSPGCTDPFQKVFLPQHSEPLTVSLLEPTRRYPANDGHDQFYGWGRVNMNRAVDALQPASGDSRVPPEAEITAPDWFEQIDPATATLTVEGHVGARGESYSCKVYVAPGSYPNNTDAPAGDFHELPSDVCHGNARTESYDGVLARIDVGELKAMFPPDAGDFRGRESGASGVQTSNGRPNTDPYGFTFKVVVTRGSGADAMTGEDRRNWYLHRDQDMLDGFPRQLRSDGESSPLFVDLDGDNRNELVLATSDGFVHAYGRDGSELPGWPVRSDPPPLHTRGRGFASGAVTSDVGAPIVASAAAGDLDRDGAPEVVAADFEGGVYAWRADGTRVLAERANPDFSGRPLAPFRNERQGERNRTQGGFLGSPVLADLDMNDGGRLEIVAANMDRHVYAWNDDGSDVGGFPALVVDESKVASVDADSHQVRFDPATAGASRQQGAIIDTPAVGDIDGDERPEIVVGTNEEYEANSGNEGDMNAGAFNTASVSLLARTGQLSLGNSRLYAIKPEGDSDDDDLYPELVDGWPFKVGKIFLELLPIVGEGVTGSPVIAPLECGGEEGPSIGVIPDAGIGYVLNEQGDSCFGKDGDKDRGVQTDASAAPASDRPTFPAVGHPAFGDFAGGTSFIAPLAGLRRALDLGLNEYQGGQDTVGAWDPESSDGQFRAGFPAQVNDLQFLTGPSVGDVEPGAAGEELIAGTAHLDLAAFRGDGTPASSRWPKLTSDWTVANPLLGSFGSLDSDAGARKVVVGLTRSGRILAYRTEAEACSPSSWPRFHHDNANSGDLRRDAVLPGRPFDAVLDSGSLFFRAPGDDLMCGRAERLDLVHSNSPIDGANFGSAESLGGAPAPAQPGTRQTVALPEGVKRYVALRAVDDQGNGGRPLVVDRSGGVGAGGGSGTGPGGGGPGAGRRACTRASGALAGRRLGPVYLGQRSGRVARLPGAKRSRRRMHRVCLTDGTAIRAGYGASRRLRGRAVLLLSSSRRYRALGNRPGSRARLPRGASRVKVGGVTWYVLRRRTATVVIGVRRGRVREVGVAARSMTRSRRAAARLLRSF